MKRFAILRDVPPTLTWDEVDTSAVQNIINMGLTDITPDLAWDPRVVGVKWIRSYWAQGTDWGMCLYTADSADSVKAWHDECGVPYAGIQEVDVIEPGGPIDYEPGFHEDPDVSRLIVLEGHADALFHEALPPVVAAAATWVRAYVDRANGSVVALFKTDDADTPALSDLESAGWKARRVVEITPGDYIEG